MQIVEALDGGDIVKAAGTSSELRGYVIYRGKPISIYDIRAIANPGASALEKAGQIIVLGQDGVPAFGIVVDELGDIIEMHASRLQPMTAMFGGATVLAEVVVGADAARGESLLDIMSVERIAQRLRAAVAERPASISIDERRTNVSALSKSAQG